MAPGFGRGSVAPEWRQTPGAPGCLRGAGARHEGLYPYPASSHRRFAVNALPVISRLHSPCQSQRRVGEAPFRSPPGRGFVAL
jgi:hypothetical protein